MLVIIVLPLAVLLILLLPFCEPLELLLPFCVLAALALALAVAAKCSSDCHLPAMVMALPCGPLAWIALVMGTLALGILCVCYIYYIFFVISHNSNKALKTYKMFKTLCVDSREAPSSTKPLLR